MGLHLRLSGGPLAYLRRGVSVSFGIQQKKIYTARMDQILPARNMETMPGFVLRLHRIQQYRDLTPQFLSTTRL